jgi:hydantoinase/carbamoylase family amidase
VSCRPERVLADLRALEELTQGRRLAWTDDWMGAREWLRARVAELRVEVEVDVVGNLWATLPGEREEFVVVGSHIDSVPDGGWLDGALGVLAGLEMLRSRAGSELPLGLRLVDFADEEGARFGQSLVGSSAVAGMLDPGPELVEAARGCGFDLTADARSQLDGARAYIELHIEQGPVLERAGRSVCAVDGCAGVERHRVRVHGETAHAGAAPMDMRRDALVAAARGILELTSLAGASGGGTATVGAIEAFPGAPTIVPGEVELVVDLRHPDPGGLAALLDGARAALLGEWERVWHIDPVPFDRELVELARDVCGGEAMTSGAIHDAAVMAPIVPTAMLFVPSKRGISHSRAEDTDEADLVAGIGALDRLLDLTIESRA